MEQVAQGEQLAGDSMSFLPERLKGLRKTAEEVEVAETIVKGRHANAYLNQVQTKSRPRSAFTRRSVSTLSQPISCRYTTRLFQNPYWIS